MALGGKNRRKDRRVGMDEPRASAGAERMCRTADQPARVTNTPVLSFANSRFREMDAVGVAAGRQFRIAGNRNADSACGGDTQESLRQRGPSRGIARP